MKLEGVSTISSCLTSTDKSNFLANNCSFLKLLDGYIPLGISLMEGIKAAPDYDTAMIPDDRMTSSANVNSYLPNKARLRESIGAWCAPPDATDNWIQVNFKDYRLSS